MCETWGTESVEVLSDFDRKKKRDGRGKNLSRDDVCELTWGKSHASPHTPHLPPLRWCWRAHPPQ